MSEQVLMAIIQLMTSILATEGVNAEDKKIAQSVLTKSLALVEKNISLIYAQRISNLVV